MTKQTTKKPVKHVVRVTRERIKTTLRHERAYGRERYAKFYHTGIDRITWDFGDNHPVVRVWNQAEMQWDIVPEHA